jgi:CheY-specific phosphatase CheX
MSGNDPRQSAADRVLSSIARRTSDYLGSEFGIEVSVAGIGRSDAEQLTLPRMTTLIALGGNVNFLVAFGFADRLIDLICARMTEGLGISAAELPGYREPAIGEAVNTIVGHCTGDLEEPVGPPITITPPVVLDGARTIRRMKDAVFYTRDFDSALGRITVSLVSPRTLLESTID